VPEENVMKVWLALISCIAAVVTADGMPNSLAASACEIGSVTNARDLHEVLARRAVEAASIAAAPAGRAESRLREIVSPDAPFNLGTGDVGRPMGQGVAGFRVMMATLRADGYRFDGWDYMDHATRARGNS
jgi:hypothetical protein